MLYLFMPFRIFSKVRRGMNEEWKLLNWLINNFNIQALMPMIVNDGEYN